MTQRHDFLVSGKLQGSRRLRATGSMTQEWEL